MSVLFLKEEELLDTSVDVCPNVVPGVGGIMLVCVTPGIREIAMGPLLGYRDIGRWSW